MKQPSVLVAAILTFLWPGLGHAYLGRRRAAAIFALPLVLATTALFLVALGGIEHLLVYAITPSGSLTILIMLLVTGLWRLLALIDSVAIARRQDSHVGNRAIAVVAALLVVMVGTHGLASYGAFITYSATSQIFVGQGNGDQPPSSPFDPASGAANASGSSDGMTPPQTPDTEFLATPLVTPAPKARITILLTGIDSAATRSTSLTDTILVVSINPNDGSVAMISVPRDISEFRLSTGQTYMGKINSLMTWARNHPKDFPKGPLPTLMQEVGYIIGTPIHYFAAVDLAGFRRLVDAIGGVTVVNHRAIDDPRYEWLDGTFGFSLPAGEVKLNGRDALAFVRSRQGVGDSDFTRAERQQQLLLAIRTKLLDPSAIGRLPDVLRIAGDTIRTNVPEDDLEAFLDIARSLDTNRVKQVVLGPPYSYHPPTDSTNGTYILRLRMSEVKAISRKLFGPDSVYAEP